MAVSSQELQHLLPKNNHSTKYESVETQSSSFSIEAPRGRYETSDEENKSTSCLHSGCRFCYDACNEQLRKIVEDPRVSRGLALIFFALLLCGIIISMTGEIANAEEQLFKIFVLAIAAYVAGLVVHLVGLPPLLGMLVMGIVLRNVNFVVITGDSLILSAVLRKVALGIILTLAGLRLDYNALKRLRYLVARLSVIPSLVEGASTAVMTYYLLDLPWIWSSLLGSVMVAVSPAVVVPLLFSLQDRGYGRTKGIPTLVIAAASFDDVIAVSAFGVVLSKIFSTGEEEGASIPWTKDPSLKWLKGPVGLLFGLFFGIVWGFILEFIPQRNDRYVVILRLLLLGGGGMLVLFGSEYLGFDAAGPLGCIVSAFVASHRWRRQEETEENFQNPVEEYFGVLWTIFQPILFSLIGTEINLSVLDYNTLGYGALCLAVSLSGRIVISVLVAFGGSLNIKEKIFVALAWYPKATVQAALAPVALDMAREIGAEEYETYAKKVFVVAVLAILLTAPLGAILISVLGPKLLEREPISEESQNTTSDRESDREIE